jgi:hypothetical protein
VVGARSTQTNGDKINDGTREVPLLSGIWLPDQKERYEKMAATEKK